MRIVLITEAFLPKTDGVVNTLCHVLDHLAERRHTSLLFAPEGGPPRYAQTRIIGLPALPFPFYPEVKLAPPLTDLREQIAAFAPDLIHTFNPFSLGIAGLRAARDLDIPIAASYQTDLPGFMARWGFGMFSNLMWNYLRWIHDQADLNFCPSEFTRRELAAAGFQRLRVWGRGVDTVRFQPAHASAEWRRRLTDGHPDAPLILAVGRMSPEKRLDWLGHVANAIPGARLALVGDGPQRPALERQFADAPVVFTGYLRGYALASAYASADLFVLTGANETFGNVVTEAMASGLPVAAPDAGGQMDHVRHEENGLVFAAEDPESMVAAVARLVHDRALARRLGAAGRAYAETLTWERTLDGLIADWQSLIEAPLDLAA